MHKLLFVVCLAGLAASCNRDPAIGPAANEQAANEQVANEQAATNVGDLPFPCNSDLEDLPGDEPCLTAGPSDVSDCMNYDELTQRWRVVASGFDEDDNSFRFITTGKCGEDLLTLGWNEAFGGLRLYFDAESREFVGLSRSSDAVDDTCQGVSYWPEPIECDSFETTETIFDPAMS